MRGCSGYSSVRGVARNFPLIKLAQSYTLSYVVYQNCRDLVTKESVLFVKSPAVTEERKFELLDEELQNRKVGSEATGRMLKKLIEDNKFNLLDDVIDNFGKLMRAKRGELIAIVTSADKLAKKTSTALKQGLEAQFENKTVIIENKARNYFAPPTLSCPYYCLSTHIYVIQQVCIYIYICICHSVHVHIYMPNFNLFTSS